ncbi:MAG: ABC transporter permease [Alphaproteobacteria bacterium]|nr:ABC transporter permease [Alphaproteobacteria bacterium]
MRFEPRQSSPLWLIASAPVIAVLVALAICAVLILWAGQSPLNAYALLFKGALGSRFAITETLTRATPMILTGMAAAIAFRAKLWNIGGEGQFYAGALMATWLGTGAIVLPSVLMVPFLLLAGALAGGLLLLLAALLKNQLKVDEVVTTLLLNFVILLLVNYLLEGPIRDPMSLGWPQAAPIIDQGVLPKLLSRSRLHVGFIVALAAAVGVWLLMRFTVWGYEIRAVGYNVLATAFAGIAVKRTVVMTALISGGLAGMAGVGEVAGTKGYLTLDLSPGFGYAGIAVAMLAALHPLAVVASAIFLAAIYVGADSMSRAVNVPTYIADVIVATSVLAVLVSVMLTRFRLRWR